MKKLQAGYRRLFKAVQSLEFIKQEIAAKAQEETRFLDGHLIWIRSAKTIGWADLINFPKALAWVVSPANWWLVVQELRNSLRRNLLWLMLMAVPLYFIVTTAQIIKEPAYSDSLGRLALVAIMIALSLFVARLLRFSGDIVAFNSIGVN